MEEEEGGEEGERGEEGIQEVLLRPWEAVSRVERRTRYTAALPQVTWRRRKRRRRERGGGRGRGGGGGGGGGGGVRNAEEVSE